MFFRYCPECGAPLALRQIGDDQSVPFCEGCDKPWFPMFPSAVCVLCLRPDGQALFVRQERIPGLSLITGFIAPGETAEQAAVRETGEETGLPAASVRYLGTHWYRRDGVLMHLITARVPDHPPVLSPELTEAVFLPVRDGLSLVDPSSTGVLTLLRLAIGAEPSPGSDPSSKNV